MPRPPKPQQYPVNLSQRWPPEERAWLKAEARRLSATETDLLVAIVRREMGAAHPAPIEAYLPPPSPRSERGKRLRREQREREAGRRAAAPPEPKAPARRGRPPKSPPPDAG